MCKYENTTNKVAIQKQITRLDAPDTATAVMDMIDTICEEAETKEDPVSHWLSLLKDREITASTVSGKHAFPLIEIYPSFKKRVGGEDRLFLEIRKTDIEGKIEVEVKAAGISSHK